MKVYKSKRHASWHVYYHELYGLALLSIGLFLAAALISYNPHDSSWFYYSHKQIMCTNWCGSIGAHCAALLFYLCGASSFLMLPLLGLIIHMQFAHKRMEDEWDRLVALHILLVVCATLCNYYAVDFWASPFPGGLVGSSVYYLLHRWFDVIGSMIFLYALFIMSIIIIMRFSFVGGIVRGMRFIQYCVQRAHFTRYARTLYIQARAYVRMMRTLVYKSATYVLNVAYEAPADVIQEDYGDIYEQQYAMPLTHGVKESVVYPSHTQVSADDGDISEEKKSSDSQNTAYRTPPVSLFTQGTESFDVRSKDECEGLARVLEDKLERFGIKGSVVAIKRGPVVTLFEYQPDIDAKLSKIVSLEDDLALALRAVSIRILAPIPGKSVVGFEVANVTRKSVFLAPLIQSRDYEQYSGVLPLILGEDTFGSRVIVDLAKMPHLLVAGSTGSGKSVALNVMLVSLLCKRTPQELRLILIDPKRLEFAAYADCAHLIFPIVTDPKRAAPILAWVVHEMERRYTVMAQRSTRTIADYNEQVDAAELLPYIVVVIDELADLMMTAGKEVEDAIARITQMARAAGIHMIVATQRPSVDVITGVIKVNFPSRISFRVMSKIDSRTILDCAGAEKLLGRGDMLFIDGQGGAIKRVHGAYVHDADIKEVVGHIKKQQAVVYHDVHEYGVHADAQSEVHDALYGDVVRFLDEIDEVSISLLQRKFRIGYNRSARLIELLEMQGLIMPSAGGKTRKVIR